MVLLCSFRKLNFALFLQHSTLDGSLVPWPFRFILDESLPQLKQWTCHEDNQSKKKKKLGSSRRKLKKPLSKYQGQALVTVSNLNVATWMLLDDTLFVVFIYFFFLKDHFHPQSPRASSHLCFMYRISSSVAV